MKTSFYTRDELTSLGLKSFGKEVFISRSASIYHPQAISVGDRVRIDDFCILSGGSGVELGNYIHLGAYSALFGGAGIVMESFSGLSARVTIYSESDDYSGRSLTNPMIPDHYRPNIKKARVVLGRHALVGVSSTILPGVEVREGAVIGAHSLVHKRCEQWAVYSGIPAKKVANRRKDLLSLEKQLLMEQGINQGSDERDNERY